MFILHVILYTHHHVTDLKTFIKTDAFVKSYFCYINSFAVFVPEIKFQNETE